MEKFLKRKPNRLQNYDYSQNGAYFITICTKDRECSLSQIIAGTSIARPPEVRLTEIGSIVEAAIQGIPAHYEGVFVDHYVVMPNHVHMLIRIERDDGRPMAVPTISRVLQQMKGYAAKQAGRPIWQSKAYDHIIRDEYDYMTRYQYIDDNPAKWLLKQDEYCE